MLLHTGRQTYRQTKTWSGGHYHSRKHKNMDPPHHLKFKSSFENIFSSVYLLLALNGLKEKKPWLFLGETGL